MLYIEDFTMRHYVRFSQIGSYMSKTFTNLCSYAVDNNCSSLMVN